MDTTRSVSLHSFPSIVTPGPSSANHFLLPLSEEKSVEKYLFEECIEPPIKKIYNHLDIDQTIINI